MLSRCPLIAWRSLHRRLELRCVRAQAAAGAARGPECSRTSTLGREAERSRRRISDVFERKRPAGAATARM